MMHQTLQASLPDITRTVHVQEIPQLSLSSESSDLLITPESPIADTAQYPYLTDPFHIETVQIDGSTYALVASNQDGGFTILNMDNPESPILVFNATRTMKQTILQFKVFLAHLQYKYKIKHISNNISLRLPNSRYHNAEPTTIFYGMNLYGHFRIVHI